MKKRAFIRRAFDALMRRSNFLPFLILLLVSLTITYLTMHAISREGYINNKVSQEDIVFLNALDTGIVSFENQTIHYLNRKYNITSDSNYERNLRHLIRVLGRKNFINALNETGIRKTSFFWLSGDSSIIEVIFWSLFGTICSFLYYFVENKKKGTLDENEFPTYVAKIFYTPFVVTIIYFSPNLFTREDNFNIFFGYWTIVVAFILGFFSGRAIELLDRLKNFIFPYNSGGSVDTNVNKPDDKLTVPENIIMEAIEVKGDEWATIYGPLESIAIGKKKVNEEKTDIICIQFDVTQKQDQTDPSRAIPSEITYLAKDGIIYHIPTDVNESGPTIKNDCYQQNTILVTAANLTRKPLGVSISRRGVQATGSIGLKVKSYNPGDNKLYILSCCHVLFNTEVNNGIYTNNNISNNSSFEIISPSLEDNGNITVGIARRGYVTDELDAAIAEITEPDLIDNRIFGKRVIPAGIIIVGASHVRSDYPVNLTGRSSGDQTGYIESHFSKAYINYPLPGDPDNVHVFNGVIKTCKISVPGDSGAAVLDSRRQVIGILVGSNSTYSYIIPILRIFKKFQIQLA